MTVAAVYDTGGKRVGEVELATSVFGLRPHTAVLHEALVWYLAGQRRGTHATLTRGFVARSTRKLYRQKGTGRARHGSRGAPLFVGGGITFGPHPRTYAYPLSKKVRRLALRSALSAKAAEGRIGVLDRLALEEPKTKVLADLLRVVGAAGSVLLVTASPAAVVERSAANLPRVRVTTAGALNVHDILASDHLLLTREALDRITEGLGS
jgi:large subunit ribosomal protein L4